MFTYDILYYGNKIGIAKGKSNAFKYIQKQIAWDGLFGYWKGEQYIVDGNVVYTMEKSDE